MSRGAIISNAEVARSQRLGNQRIGDNNIMDRGVTLGAVANGAVAGKLDAVWAVKILPVGYVAGELEIPHALGRVPLLVMLAMQEGAGAVSARATSRDKWTATTARVTLASATGSMDNLSLTFLIA